MDSTSFLIIFKMAALGINSFKLFSCMIHFLTHKCLVSSLSNSLYCQQMWICLEMTSNLKAALPKRLAPLLHSPSGLFQNQKPEEKSKMICLVYYTEDRVRNK